ncbi:mediator of RNA polymerase II transcription subunit 9 [Gasterosteus aculeatus]|uniref:Mediator of RNA polymerase II transcription subunit 9 n=1 Tax=Gasterosteus aculeatus aculeatus TaxID=481459 RepID=A0AAQ4S0F2_GASAC|nr:mediator of RNA polymerase II transcription subunit 9 [Gasterosteus aculeatus aculeatus]
MAMAASQPREEKESEDCSLLPLVHDIIKCMDKDSQDVHQELAKLKAKIQEARELISNMPGVDSSPPEQQQQLATLREQVQTKNQLLQKYKSLCMFDVPKAS